MFRSAMRLFTLPVTTRVTTQAIKVTSLTALGSCGVAFFGRKSESALDKQKRYTWLFMEQLIKPAKPTDLTQLSVIYHNNNAMKDETLKRYRQMNGYLYSALETGYGLSPEQVQGLLHSMLIHRIALPTMDEVSSYSQAIKWLADDFSKSVQKLSGTDSYANALKVMAKYIIDYHATVSKACEDNRLRNHW